MTLMKKLKETSKAIMLSAAILSASMGCASTDWKTIRTEFNPTGVKETINIPAGEETILQKEFQILEPYFQNNILNIPIRESIKKITYNLNKKITSKQLEEVKIQKRTEEMDPLYLLAPIALGCIGASLGDSEEGNTSSILGLGGFALGMCIIPLGGEEVTRRLKTGETKYDIINKILERKIVEERLIYDNDTAKKIKVSISNNSKSGILYTDNSGLLRLGDSMFEFFEIPNVSFSKTNLEQNPSFLSLSAIYFPNTITLFAFPKILLLNFFHIIVIIECCFIYPNLIARSGYIS